MGRYRRSGAPGDVDTDQIAEYVRSVPWSLPRLGLCRARDNYHPGCPRRGLRRL